MTRRIQLFIIFLLLHYSSPRTCYVKPDESQSCGQDIPSCATLSHYASENSSCLNSNDIRLLFLSGHHHLNKDIKFANLHNITLDVRHDVKAGETEIVCRDGGFWFENITNLTLTGLNFTHCGKARRIGQHFQPYLQYDLISRSLSVALFLSNITNLSMKEVSVQNSIGYGAFLSGIHGSSTIERCIFENNTGSNAASPGGNAVLAYYQCSTKAFAEVEVVGCQFLGGKSHDTASGLLVFISECPNVNITILESIFYNNQGASQNQNCTDASNERSSGGNIALILARQHCSSHAKNTGFPIIGIYNSTISQGKACFGGGVFININRSLHRDNVRISIANTSLTSNSAIGGGGAVYVLLNSQCIYRVNSRAVISNILVQNCSFVSNSLKTNTHAGVALMVASQSFGTQHSSPSISLESSSFQYNHVDMDSQENTDLVGAALYVSHIMERLNVTDCNFTENGVAGVLSFHSVLTVGGNVLIDRNSGYEGGGMVLREASYLLFRPNSTLTISHNHANYTGGGVYVEELYAQLQDPCFYQILSAGEDDEMEILKSVTVELINNTAKFGGDQIYGGRLETCTTASIGRSIFPEIFEMISENSDNLSRISSEPDRVSFCVDGEPGHDCPNIRVYSGEEFNVSIALTGQCEGITPGEVDFTLIPSKNQTTTLPTKIPFFKQRECSNYTLSVATTENSATFDVSVKEMLRHPILKQNAGHTKLNVAILETPLGFVSTGDSSEPYQCIKQPNITNYRFKCKRNHTGAHVSRKPPYWLGFVNETDKATGKRVSGFILYKFCPGNYCKRYTVRISTNASVFDQDAQCNSNRSGLLCGRCKPGLSLSIGTSDCLDCRGYSIAKTIAISVGFLLLGLLLVLMLVVFDLTVTHGSVNEFLLYCNAVYLFWFILQPPTPLHNNLAVDTLSYALSFFVSSINLILGCNCCYYDGFNVIGRTWVQFILVAYLWIIAGVVILASRRFVWVSKLAEHNAVHVLATMFVLSHTSTSLAILHALSGANLEYPPASAVGGNNGTTGKHLSVLLYNASVPYFSGVHIPLCIVSCVFLVLLLGFTLLLLFVQPLQRFSHLRPFRWVNRLKPLLDAYTCPHIIKPRCRFWSGYLLLTRCVIYIIFTTNVGHGYYMILDVLSIVCLMLLGTSLVFGGVYTKTHLNVLSSFYLVCLGMLSVSVRHLYSKKGDNIGSIGGVNMFFTGLVTLVFLCTVGYHLYKRFRKSGLLKFLKSAWTLIKRKKEERCQLVHHTTYCSMDACAEEMGENPLVVTTSTTSSHLDIHSTHPPLSNLNYREPQLMDYDDI